MPPAVMVSRLPLRVDDRAPTNFDDAVARLETRVSCRLNQLHMGSLVAMVMDIVSNLPSHNGRFMPRLNINPDDSALASPPESAAVNSRRSADLLLKVCGFWTTKTEKPQTLKSGSALPRRWDDSVRSYFSKFATVPPANSVPSPIVKIRSPHNACSRAAHMTDRFFKYVEAKSSPPAAARIGAQTLPNTM